MGDPRRFHLFADVISRNFPNQQANIVDVASGKGYLQAALRQLGYKKITSWDKRHKNAKNRKGYRYGYFDYRNANRDYDLVVAMHPDEGTDHSIMYAAKHRVPFIICPCCVKPSAKPYHGATSYYASKGYNDWIDHLVQLAEAEKFDVRVSQLKIQGRNIIIIGRPLKNRGAGNRTQIRRL